MEHEQISEPARRRATLYARQPSLWPAPSSNPPSRRDWARRCGRVVRTAVTAVVLVAGPPWLLWQAFGNPVTVASSWWATGPFLPATASSPVAGLRVAGIWAAWLTWAAIATLLAGSAAAVLRGRRLPRWRLPMPLHRLVFGLTGTTMVALATTAPAIAAVASVPTAHPAATPPTAQNSAPHRGNAAGHGDSVADIGPVTLNVAGARYEYRVRRGDTLSAIADVWLGDPDRWPDICHLNKHRHFNVGGTLTDCDLIQPGWELRLPAEALPPPSTRPAPPRRPPIRLPAPENPDPVPASPAPTTPTATAAPTTSTEADDSDGGTADVPRDRRGEDLVLPGGSAIPWALAAAISTTAALVWLQRRRRYVPGTSDEAVLPAPPGLPAPPALPAPVLAAQRHTHDAPTPTSAVTLDDTLPSGGIGLVGEGADAAARGLIITALTTGGPADPDDRAEVIIDRRTLTELIGDTPIAGWRRLHITDTLDQALTLLDTHLLHRARILDEHGLADLDTVRETAPAEEALPPLLLITSTDLANPSSRARITFALTSGLNTTVVVLGHWPHGPTVSVTDDGHTHTTPTHAATIDGRLAVLDPDTTRDLLTTTREAHTGEPPDPAPHAPAAPQPADPATEPATISPTNSEPDPEADEPEQSLSSLDQPPPAVGEPHAKVHLRVLGNPTVDGITLPGRDLRRRAAELAVYLACHPDGGDTETIAEYLVPDLRRRQAKQLIHTNASNLRHVLGRAGGPITGGYLLKRGGSARYRLDPSTVAVDLWQLRDLLTRAQLASAPARTDLLKQACDRYTAPLAEGCDYEWVEPHREQVRQWGTEAHLLLADDLMTSDPQAASDLLDKAIALDRYNEQLYRKAMHARHALRDADGIRALLRALTKAFADLDAEPAETTVELAAKLRTSLEQQ